MPDPSPAAWPPDRVPPSRAAAQALGPRPATDVLDAVRRTAGLQAQDRTAVRLAVRARTVGLTTADVARAYDERLVVRTWLMRNTLHLVPAADVGWLTRLYGPALVAGDRRRRAQLGLTDDLCARALPVLREVLAGGPLSRAELVDRLRVAGVDVPAAGQAPAHLVGFAAASGVLVRGPDRDDGEPLYVLLDAWVGSAVVADGPEGEDAVRALAARYVAAYGPAGERDLGAWSGLGLRRCRAALAALAGSGAVVEVDVDGGAAYVMAEVAEAGAPEEGEPVVRLVPAFDTYVLGYRDRDLVLDPAHARRVLAGGGWLHPGVVVDGRYAGTWRLRRTRTGVTVEVDPFEPNAIPEDGLAAEVEDVVRFLA